jgi:hypothetical protein
MEELTSVVINTCHGGFGLSEEGNELYKQLAGAYFNHGPRHDIILVRVVRELKKVASDEMAELTIVRIPSEFKDCYRIDVYDGKESINIDSNLLIEHELKLLDVNSISPGQCKLFLLELQKISETNYYDLIY